MKILFVHNRYRHEGGEEAAVDNLARLLLSNGHEIVCFEHRSSEWTIHRGWQRIRDAAQTFYSFDCARELDVLLDQFHPEIVHFHNVFPVISPSVYDLVRKRNVPAVQTIHNYRFLCANGLFLTPKGEICERCKGGSFWSAVRFGCYGNSRIQTVPMAASLAFHRAKKTVERAISHYIVPTSFVRSKLIEAQFPAERIIVIPHLTVIPSAKESRSATPLFLYVGRLSKEKGLWTLLQAFLDKKLGQLVLIGDGPLRNELQEFATGRELRHISFLGQLEPVAVARWLTRAWVLIAPSECYETFGQVIVEAWSCGTPVIVSRLGALAELVCDDETGWTFKAGDAAELAQKIRYISEHPERIKSMSEKCRVAAQKSYNTEEIYSKLIAVYEHTISDRAINVKY